MYAYIEDVLLQYFNLFVNLRKKLYWINQTERAEPKRTEQNRTEPNWIELNWIDLNWIGLNWIELNWIELNWIELHWIEWHNLSANRQAYKILGPRAYVNSRSLNSVKSVNHFTRL